MNRKLKFKHFIILITLWGVTNFAGNCSGSSSTADNDPSNPPAPPPVQSNIGLDFVGKTDNPWNPGPYSCTEGTPGELVNNSLGGFNLRIAGDEPINAKFKIWYYYRPGAYGNSGPLVTTLNGTSQGSFFSSNTVNGGGASDHCFIQCPQSGGFWVSLYVMQYNSSAPQTVNGLLYNNSTCQPPNCTMCCYKWVDNHYLLPGTVPDYANDGWPSVKAVIPWSSSAGYGNCLNDTPY
jgi:hypothetical protein